MTKDRDRDASRSQWRITEPSGRVRRGGLHAALRAEAKGWKVEIVPTTRQKRIDRAWRDAGIGTD